MSLDAFENVVEYCRISSNVVSFNIVIYMEIVASGSLECSSYDFRSVLTVADNSFSLFARVCFV